MGCFVTPLEGGGGRTIQQCPRADYRLPGVRKGCQTGPLRLQALSPRTGSDPVVVVVHTGPSFTMDAECAPRSIIVRLRLRNVSAELEDVRALAQAAVLLSLSLPLSVDVGVGESE